jgi:predicted TIM-barrel fold metal-dependent hydrolase
VQKIWTNSGDSHFLEPESLFTENLPEALAERMPRSVPDGEGFERIHVDGRSFRRRLPNPAQLKMRDAIRPPGASDVAQRLRDLDDQGVWGELVFPSLGLWYGQISDPDLAAAAAVVLNDYVHDVMSISPRFVPTATLPLQSIEKSTVELERCVGLGFKALFLPVDPPEESPYWNADEWEPVWQLADEAGLVVAFHIGTDRGSPVKFKGPGGALINYLETSFGGQRAVGMMVAAGVLERHPDLRILVSEGGATWVPFLGDRMNECYRQQPMFHDGRVTRPPKEYVMSNVYASFQHDETAVGAMAAMGYRNVLFGTDYPHLEGTFPDTQKVLHELLDGADESIRDRITIGTFLELFPHVGRPPAEVAPTS